MNKDRLQELLAIPYDGLAFNSDLKKELTEYYKFIYGVKTCSSCKDKFPQYYKKLMTDGIEKMEQLEMASTNNFKLRSTIGVVQINFGDGEFISPAYSPDALCIEFLKANPNRISMFEKYPENWKDLITN
ncbi:hypothetical protein ABGT15_04565 [Flavobacterium enshiense]|uniref:hypothetical protein n=1 Tax=Flavobacterium enshiense TaxID=1341165 RepID=UPI00345DA9F8